MLLFPNADMPYDVAATAWTQLVGCDDLRGRRDARRDPRFRDNYRGQGPEPVPSFSTSPRPEPARTGCDRRCDGDAAACRARAGMPRQGESIRDRVC